jgi:hypothetical protein
MENNVYLDRDELAFLMEYVDGKLIDLASGNLDDYNLSKGFYRYIWVKLDGAIEKIGNEDSSGTLSAL